MVSDNWVKCEVFAWQGEAPIRCPHAGSCNSTSRYFIGVGRVLNQLKLRHDHQQDDLASKGNWVNRVVVHSLGRQELELWFVYISYVSYGWRWDKSGLRGTDHIFRLDLLQLWIFLISIVISLLNIIWSILDNTEAATETTQIISNPNAREYVNQYWRSGTSQYQGKSNLNQPSIFCNAV